MLSSKIKQYGKIVFMPQAEVFHQPRDSWRKVWQWFFRRGRAAYVLVKNKKFKFSFLSFVLSSPYIRFFVFLLLAIFINIWILPVVLFLNYIWILNKYRCIYWYGHSLKTHLLLPVIRTWMDMAYHAGFAAEYIIRVRCGECV